MLRMLFISLALIVTAPTALADHRHIDSPEALVTQAAADISKSDRTHIADTMLSHVDTRAIANFTLGRYGAGLSAADKTRFIRAFESYLHRQIEANAHQFSGVEVSVTDTKARNARDAIVTTEIRGAGDSLKVRWRVIERKGSWSVVDLEVAGIWLAIEQRAQVAAILSRPGADIEDLIVQLG
ncbi:MAG: ABC transporter substrate-binding protein [Pseudomonadota bacterium]